MHTPDMDKRRKARPGQGAVRISQFEKSMDAYDREVGAKLVVLLGQFHGKFIRPLEDRVAYLEALPHQKLWYQLTRLWRATLGQWIRFERVEPEPALQGGEDVSAPEQTPTAQEPAAEVPPPAPSPEPGFHDRRSSSSMPAEGSPQ